MHVISLQEDHGYHISKQACVQPSSRFASVTSNKGGKRSDHGFSTSPRGTFRNVVRILVYWRTFMTVGRGFMFLQVRTTKRFSNLVSAIGGPPGHSRAGRSFPHTRSISKFMNLYEFGKHQFRICIEILYVGLVLYLQHLQHRMARRPRTQGQRSQAVPQCGIRTHI